MLSIASPHAALLAQIFLALLPLLAGCYGMRASNGGAQARYRAPQRELQAQDVAVPIGYRIEKVAGGLTYPTAVVFDDRQRIYVVEAGYSLGESWATPRLLRLEPDDRWSVLAAGDRNGPWNGAVFYQGHFYVSEGGQLEGGRILKIDPDGKIYPIVEGLPSQGDHHTTGPAIGPDGYVYFGQGTFTNSGVVGPDNEQFGWLGRFPEGHDVPCADLTLSGANFQTHKGLTGPFLPLGSAARKGQGVKAKLPCNGAIMRVAAQGGGVELVAWGFRNPFGLAFSPQGKLVATDNGYDDRGTRPIWGGADLLWTVSSGAWHGWPDFSGDRPLSDPEFKRRGRGAVALALAKAPQSPPKPTAWFAAQASASGLDFSRSDRFGHVGQAFVAEFGDLAPLTGKVLGAVGFKVVRVDLESGVVEDFAVNKGARNGPASLLATGGLERPIAVRFSPDGESLYVVDFGVMTVSKDGPQPRKATGALWKITRH